MAILTIKDNAKLKLESFYKLIENEVGDIKVSLKNRTITVYNTSKSLGENKKVNLPATIGDFKVVIGKIENASSHTASSPTPAPKRGVQRSSSHTLNSKTKPTQPRPQLHSQESEESQSSFNSINFSGTKNNSDTWDCPLTLEQITSKLNNMLKNGGDPLNIQGLMPSAVDVWSGCVIGVRCSRFENLPSSALSPHCCVKGENSSHVPVVAVFPVAIDAKSIKDMYRKNTQGAYKILEGYIDYVLYSGIYDVKEVKTTNNDQACTFEVVKPCIASVNLYQGSSGDATKCTVLEKGSIIFYDI